jgi:endonuclease/exonuclease/phosphatase family metal-dependent hydrolase
MRNAARWLCTLAIIWLAQACAAAETEPRAAERVRIATWNIWHGGREDGAELGPQRVVEVLRETRADVIALQETYGSGELIAEALGFQLLARGTNVSLLTRHTIVADLSVFEPFKCVGALLELPSGERLVVYSLWLPYDAEIWEAGTRPHGDRAALLAACASSARDIELVVDAIDARLAADGLEHVPLVLAGDFNSMSHLDYTELALEQYGDVVEWPTSLALTERGLRDAYREKHPHVERARDRTWSPRFPAQEQDRIDFIHFRGALAPREARVIDTHAGGFPSDHAALTAEFELLERLAAPRELRAASYNIRHGRGLDGRVDLERTAQVLARLDADLIALQEVDLGVQRSGALNQPLELARRLEQLTSQSYHASFGAFMPHDGGRYGMALLSRRPVQRVRSVRLPDGNEPRIALAVDLLLEDATCVTAIGVHLDWVDDDTLRFAQAQALAEFVRELRNPWILLGDFNDAPQSRTLNLLRDMGQEVEKLDARGAPAVGVERFTFSADAPTHEIDYVLAGEPPHSSGAWDLRGGLRVLDEPLASDHRPLLARLLWRSAYLR